MRLGSSSVACGEVVSSATSTGVVFSGKAASSSVSSSATTGGNNGFSTGLSTIAGVSTAEISVTVEIVCGSFETTTSLLSSEGAIAPATFSFFSIRTLFLRSGCSFCSFLSAGAVTSFSGACWVLSAVSAVSAFATLGDLAGRPLLRPSAGFLASFSFIFSAWMPA